MFVKLSRDIWVDACKVEHVRLDTSPSAKPEGSRTVYVSVAMAAGEVLVPIPPGQDHYEFLEEVGKIVQAGRPAEDLGKAEARVQHVLAKLDDPEDELTFSIGNSAAFLLHELLTGEAR